MIQGKNATLLPFDASTLQLVRAWINDETVRRGTGTEGPVSDFEHQRWYEAAIADRSQRMFVIGMGSGSQATPVGLLGLRGVNWRSRDAEYWIYIGEGSARGKGVADEASRLLLRFAFHTLGLHRIFLQVDAINERAIRLYQRLGFREEGVLKQASFVDGRFVDRILYAMLADEFNGDVVE
jgi:RimJ/RimL family protein N-acetyltransferase